MTPPAGDTEGMFTVEGDHLLLDLVRADGAVLFLLGRGHGARLDIAGSEYGFLVMRQEVRYLK